MWLLLICGVVLVFVLKRFFYEDDALLDLDSSHSNALFTVAKRLEKLYPGGKVYVGLRIPDLDSGSPRNIDLLLITHHEAVVISVNSVSGFVSTDKDGNWVVTGGKHHRTECISDPVAEAKESLSILQEYLEQRGVALPEGYLSFKVICPNPKFCSIYADSFPPEVVTYDQWALLKPEQGKSYAGWIKGALGGGKKMQESFSEKLNSIFITAPTWDRLELKGNKYVLGEFIEFKGKQEDLQDLSKIRRSKVSHVAVQKISMFGLARSTVQVLYTPRDYRSEGPSQSSEWKELTVRSSTEVVFQPQSSKKQRKYKLSSVISLSLGA